MSFCKIIPYTFEDDVTPDPDKAGVVMLAWEGGAITGHEKVLDNIPSPEAREICYIINTLHHRLS